MVTGVLGAVAQNEFRRILSFHIVSQIGYMIMGLALFTPLALAGSVFYIIHHIIVKSNLFLIGGVIERLKHTGELKKLGGLYQQKWTLSLLFLIPALSLAGIPPFSGFFAKLSLVQAGLLRQEYFIVAISLVVSLLTLFSMTKVWNEVFWKPVPGGEHAAPAGLRGDGRTAEGVHVMVKEATEDRYHSVFASFIPIGALAAITVFIGLGAGVIFAMALRAGEELMNPAGYILAVLGG
jgi:multicomponent Na+:H+ antiporter subunit D